MSYEIDGVRLVDDVGNVYDIEEWLDMHGYVELPRDANGITDELRKWWVRKFPVMDKELHKDFTAIADRIDVEYEKAMSEQPYTIDMVPITDERMAVHGWVRLPVDANGECIRVGDKMDGYGKTIEVVELRIGRSGWVIVSRDGNAYDDTFAFTHHKPPTVEDVLWEFLRDFDEWRGYSGPISEAPSSPIDKYIERLQLKEGE